MHRRCKNLSVEDIAKSRTLPFYLVIRGRVVVKARQGEFVTCIAKEFRLSEPTIRAILHSFNEQGEKGLYYRKSITRNGVLETEVQARFWDQS